DYYCQVWDRGSDQWIF
nr:immunoglobulin light chain junction region [Macaca mulatta]